MIGDNGNDTKFACTFSYCPDTYERDSFQEVFICLYSWKYNKGDTLYDMGDSEDTCKADYKFQCLCADGAGVPKVSFFLVSLLFCERVLI